MKLASPLIFQDGTSQTSAGVTGASNVPFYKASGVSSVIPLVSGLVPFYKADGTSSNFSLV